MLYKAIKLSLMSMVIMLFATGCWDRYELTDRAFIMATGLDEGPDGSIIESVQIAIPSQMGDSPGAGKKEEPFFVMEAGGKTVLDAANHIQAKLSRKVFKGHRRTIYIGQSLAEHGLEPVLDEFTRNPEVRLRTDIFVVKDGQARDIIGHDYPFERVPGEAPMKIHGTLGGYPADQTLAQFLKDNASQTNCSTLPLISNYEFVGRAIFNRDMKMIGELNSEDSIDRFWVADLLRNKELTKYIQNGHGYVTLSLTKLHSRVQPIFHGNTVTMQVTLYASGTIAENGTKLDVLNESNFSLIKREFEAQQRNDVIRVIKKIQQDDRTDILHFGQSIHRKNPYRWKLMKNQWQSTFPNVPVDVTVQLNINQSGLTGRPLQIRQET